ncbi:uncharacterized protein B0H18DRAFT_842751, partial [Fomitopsis serialis]|uniref:uncharacterized protein n=1 Tax=Fomitopsis serialis TaxID=139415 RepID=UPI0020071E71
RCCTNCQDPGHRAPQCPLPRGDNRKCGGCGETGHVPHECEKREAQVRCYLCRESGHQSNEC